MPTAERYEVYRLDQEIEDPILVMTSNDLMMAAASLIDEWTRYDKRQRVWVADVYGSGHVVTEMKPDGHQLY